MSVCQVANINDVFLPMIKATGSKDKELLSVYKAALEAVRHELSISTIAKIIDDSSLSFDQKSALIRSIERSTGTKVTICVGYSVAGVAGGAAVGGGAGLAATLIPGVTIGMATAGPVGAAIGGAAGLAVGLVGALSKL
jgi:hypothetical protein